MGKRPLPGRGESTIYPGFVWDSLPQDSVTARAHMGVKDCRIKDKNDEVVALWMI